MSGVSLSAPELAYLLTSLRATSVMGLDDPRLFPADPAERQALLGEGRRRLIVNGWLRPGKKPGQLDLDNSLTLLAAVVADPEFVLLTVRVLPAAGQAQVLRHYLAVGLIVEVMEAGSGQFQLGFVPDLAATAARLAELLQLGDPAPAQTPPPAEAPGLHFTLPESAFEALQALAGDHAATAAAQAEAPPATGPDERGNGARQQAPDPAHPASALLAEHGLTGPAAADLLAALGPAAGGGQLVLGRRQGGRLVAGRRLRLCKAQAADGSPRIWVAQRPEPKTPVLAVEALPPGGLSQLLDGSLLRLMIEG